MKSQLSFRRFFLGFACVSAAASAQTPIIQPGGVVNTASQAPQSVPNGSIAQGSVFTVYLSNTLPVPSALISAYPVTTSFNNLSMTVNVGGTAVPVLMFGCAPYFAGTVVDGILPSSTPAGTGTITVTFQGKTSAPAPITVVAGNFAWFTDNAGGFGPGAFADGNAIPLGPTHSVNPGQTIVGYGTGLGAAPSNDTAGGHVVINPTNFQLFVGGVQVPAGDIAFSGRASSAGEDQINFKVPQGILGCFIPVVAQIGNIVSNSATIPIAASGSLCDDSALKGTSINPSDLTAVASKGSVSKAEIDLFRFVGQGDSVSSKFKSYTSSDLFVGAFTDNSSLGTCAVKTNGGGGNTGSFLNVGASISVKGAAGTVAIPVCSQ